MSHDPGPLSAGVPVRAVDFPRAVQNFLTETSNNINLTNTSYSNGTPEVGVRFMAPSSGRVAVVLGAGVRNNSAANEDRIFVAFRILEGDPADGEEYQAAEVKLGRSNTAAGADDAQYGGHATMVQGLTPGEWYYGQIRYRTTLGSGTADVFSRHIFIFPLP